MERDFMGLNSKECVDAVKEEFVEGSFEDSGFGRSSGVPWPLPSKVSVLPCFMSLKTEQDVKKPSKMESGFLASFKSGSEIFDMNKKPSGDIQNLGGATAMQQLLAGNSLRAPIPNHIMMSSLGDISKPSNSGGQFTIFYNGTVNVFDDISPEKAQAIIFLAGNGCVSSNISQSKFQMQSQAVSRFPSPDKVLRNQSMNLQSPFAVSSSKPITDVSAPNSNVNVGSFAANAMLSSAVPQARKASLARFLEKRRERMMNATPYNMSKKPNDCATPDSTGFSATSGITGSGSMSINGNF